ncbi:MAG: glycosyltransferase family 4 protein [Cytophagales bacterium]|nr:glycosyltransferase family 4 protein [Cytophagales bacterium]
MKIGIEAKWFFEGPASGRVVIRNLVEQFIALSTGHEVYVFLDARARQLPFPHQAPHVRLVYIWGGNNMLSNLFVLPRRAARLGLDVVVFQNFSPLFAPFRRIAYIHDVLFLSNPEYYTLKERLYFLPLKRLTRAAERACTVSHEEKKRLLKYGYKDDASQVDVIYHGVSPVFRPRERFDASYLAAVRDRYRLPDQYVLFVGRLNIRKNIDHLLQAIPLLRNTRITLVIAGAQDWKMFDFQNLIGSLSITDRVQLIGAVHGEELAAVYAMATVFCFPSYAESFGLPALEAMAAGVPVVVSNTTSLPEICGEAGSYIAPDQPGQIAGRIDELLENEALYQEKKKLGLHRAASFTWQQSAQRLMECIYHAVPTK